MSNVLVAAAGSANSSELEQGLMQDPGESKRLVVVYYSLMALKMRQSANAGYR